MSVSIYWKMALCLFGTVGLPLRLIGRTEHLLKGCQTVEGARWCHSYRGRCDVAPAGCAGAPNPWRWTSLGAAPQNEAWPRRKEMRSAWRQLCIINRWDHCMSMWNGYGSIPINTIFRGLFTSINPSYFDVHQGYYWFWHTAKWLWKLWRHDDTIFKSGIVQEARTCHLFRGWSVSCPVFCRFEGKLLRRQFLVKLKPLAVSFHVMIHFISPEPLPDTEHSISYILWQVKGKHGKTPKYFQATFLSWD